MRNFVESLFLLFRCIFLIMPVLGLCTNEHHIDTLSHSYRYYAHGTLLHCSASKSPKWNFQPRITQEIFFKRSILICIIN